MASIAISDEVLKKVSSLKGEIEMRVGKTISLRELEDAICEYVLGRKEDFLRFFEDNVIRR
ncbi:MAG: hypothetical protein ACXQTS_04005 [Candidatus Methanospirareceae archaeon]